MRRLLRQLVVLLIALLFLAPPPVRPARGAVDAGIPRREDRGDLIVLHLYGSYYEMGQQEARLLGPVARRMYEYGHDRYEHFVKNGSWHLKLIDLAFSVMPWVGPLYEHSGFFEEMNGIADELKVPRADLLRAVSATSFGSTVFAATRSATANGKAIIGRNVDWEDAGGTMRPVLMMYHPNNGDMAFIMAGWPLIGAPAIGINEAGFALSFNFFIVKDTLGFPPRMRDRRALETAHTVKEGLHVFTDVSKRAMPTFMVMADAGGDIAMIECTPTDYAIFRPKGDWFAQANSARTEKMKKYDLYRAEDSFRRRAAMEAAVRRHLGSITPVVASQILRDRSNSKWINDATVANLTVLNSAVIDPAAKIIWHSTTMQPEAPFGEMVPFSVGADVSHVAPLPADPRLHTPSMRNERLVIAAARRAVDAYRDGNYKVAEKIWDGFAAENEPLLQPDRLTYGRAAARWGLGDLDAADKLFAQVDTDRAPFDVRGTSLLARAVIADVHGKRQEALQRYRAAQSFLGTHPEFTDEYTAKLRRVAAAGLAAPQTRESLLNMPDLQYVPD